MSKDGVWDARAKWDQLLDGAVQEWARAARDVGDTVAIAASILKHEVGSVPDHASVVALAALIIERRGAGADNPMRAYADHLSGCARKHYTDADDDAPSCDCGLFDAMLGR
jgi:hypothetical protein